LSHETSPADLFDGGLALGESSKLIQLVVVAKQ